MLRQKFFYDVVLQKILNFTSGFISPPFYYGIDYLDGGDDLFLARRPQPSLQAFAFAESSSVSASGPSPPAGVRVRSLFPESWIWTQGTAG